jgi:hypothetical protein
MRDEIEMTAYLRSVIIAATAEKYCEQITIKSTQNASPQNTTIS